MVAVSGLGTEVAASSSSWSKPGWRCPFRRDSLKYGEALHVLRFTCLDQRRTDLLTEALHALVIEMVSQLSTRARRGYRGLRRPGRGAPSFGYGRHRTSRCSWPSVETDSSLEAKGPAFSRSMTSVNNRAPGGE